jgi:hypothetical protein
VEGPCLSLHKIMTDSKTKTIQIFLPIAGGFVGDKRVIQRPPAPAQHECLILRFCWQLAQRC